MPSQDSPAAKIIADAEALLTKVQRELDEGAEFFRANGINRDKVLPALDAHLDAKGREDLKKTLEADLLAVQRDVDEGMARLNFATAAVGAPKKPRAMV